MKPVFKCDYCDFMDVEDKVKEHEITCVGNYTRQSCFTCVHKSYKNIHQLNCACGIEVPEDKIYEFCPKYERKEKTEISFDNLFGELFGGFK